MRTFQVKNKGTKNKGYAEVRSKALPCHDAFRLGGLKDDRGNVGERRWQKCGVDARKDGRCWGVVGTLKCALEREDIKGRKMV